MESLPKGRELVKTLSDLQCSLINDRRELQNLISKFDWYLISDINDEFKVVKRNIKEFTSDVERARKTFEQEIYKIFEQEIDKMPAKPYSYAGSSKGEEELRRLIEEVPAGRIVESSHRQLPASLPQLKSYPRVGSKPRKTIVARTSVLCDTVKDVIRWKYDKLSRKENKNEKHLATIENMKEFFGEIDQFQKYISRNPQDSYVSQAKSLSTKLGEFFDHNFTPSEKERVAKFIGALDKELKIFHKRFRLQ